MPSTREQRYTAAELEEFHPVISESQADDLHIDTGRLRVWLCRCGVADGMPYDNQITHEHYNDGLWTTAVKYEG